ncbi:HAMP domain-containing sensor histidine kinase [Myroides phaeus]|uniref:sensor histidine kinase n=1 Tax=Myroides phaeus TaxID=702745 RepID=UPI002DBC7D45|nr:HAMP domain-containing sensor histidine kinase [Myroides phaeus]MEC4117016.1 HAMP domain-containing sensor histidine kinase [Myroides phaeus]
MKIRDRLSLQFSGLFTILLSCVLVTVYILVNSHWKNEFYKQLENRAFTVGDNYLAEDNFTPTEFAEVLRNFPRTLPHETIRIYTTEFEPMFIDEGNVKWDKEILNQVIEKNKVYFKKNEQQVVGIFYNDNSGDFIVMAKATNETGIAALSQLRTVMFTSLLIALLITFWLSGYFAGYFLRPIIRINKHIQQKKLPNLFKPISLAGMPKDEIQILSETINNLFHHLQESFDNQQAFIAHASHELKTPIASLLGNAEIALMNTRTNEEYIKVLHQVINEALHMDQMINNLLTLSKLDSTAYPLEITKFEEFWWSMLDQFLSLKPSLNFNLIIENKEDLQKLYFKGNATLLELALSNIIFNAKKFSHNQLIDITLKIEKNDILIIVKDRGIGVKKEDIEKLTIPFFRSNNAFTIEGTGLGLSLAFKIIKLHSGKLQIISELHSGTTVYINIPRHN